MANEISVVEYSGLPIAAVDRYGPGVLQTYQDVVSWEVPTGKQGVVFEASVTTNNFTNTQVRLQFKRPLTGTLTFVNGSATVTGSGTLFTTELEAGDQIILDDDETWATIDSIASATVLTLSAVYSGTGGSGDGSKVWGFEDAYLQAALSLPWNDNKLNAGDEVKIQTQSDDGTSITVDGSITGKTLEYE